MTDATSSIDKIIDRLPYSDGTLRRRLVSGGMIMTAALLFSLDEVKPIFEKIDYQDLLTSPIVTFGFFLLIYAVGNIIDLVGEIFLVRAASGVFWAIMLPKRYLERRRLWVRVIGRSLLCFCVPFVILWNVVRGLVGFTSYRAEIKPSLSNEGKRLYDSLPAKVSQGFTQPIGNDAETAWKYIVEQFDKDIDRKWAGRLISRAKDVLAVTTSFIVIIAGLLVLMLPTLFIPEPLSKYRTNIGSAASSLRYGEYYAIAPVRKGTLVKLVRPRTTVAEKILKLERSRLEKKLPELQTEPTEQVLKSRTEPAEQVLELPALSEADKLIGSQAEALRRRLSRILYMDYDDPDILTSIDTAISLSKNTGEKLTELKEELTQHPFDLNQQLSDISSYLLAYKSELEKWKSEKEQIPFYGKTGIFVAGFILLMLLYIGFFITLRNAIINILDVLAIKSFPRPPQEQSS